MGAALAAFPRWAQGLPFEERGCVGASVAMPETGEGRFEPVAGAPGENKLFTWFCTPLPGDDAFETLCL